jgi:phosphate starvation-inducible PhoH-like protein
MAIKKAARVKRKEIDVTDIKTLLNQPIKFKSKKFKFTEKQKDLLDIILNPDNKIVFISGPAGTSKTYLSLYGALQIMQQNKEKDLIYIRSIAESADKGLGSLPGDISEKFDPFLMPLYDKLEEIIHAGDVAFLKNEGKISAAPINFLRGASWRDKLIVADEAQNFTFKELTTLITRIGEDTKIIICGDFMQSDIHHKGGFSQMFDIFNDQQSESNGICSFSFNESDIVRSQILKFIIRKLEQQ